jgi:LacI family transcriptional regulator
MVPALKPLEALPRVALLFHTNEQAHRDILKGVLRYVRIHGPWSLRVAEERSGERRLRSFRSWGVSGIVGVVQDRAYAELVRSAAVPAVVIDPVDAAALPRGFLKRFPVFSSDQRAIGEMAAAHFLERGFVNFAYVGTMHEINWSRDRGAAFAAALAKAGHACAVFGPRVRGELGAWLRALPKPVAVFAAMDVRARQVLDACLEAKLSVPDEVAVLGVDNDTLICESTFPPLSSIVLDTERMGYEAARALGGLMRRRSDAVRRVLFPPCAVAGRASTETLLMADGKVREAVAFIRLNASDPALGVLAVARRAGLSRRLLEIRFRRALNRTPLDELRRVRLQRVRAMLLETNLPVTSIAAACGFGNASYLGRAFRAAFGASPLRFRKASVPSPC